MRIIYFAFFTKKYNDNKKYIHRVKAKGKYKEREKKKDAKEKGL